MPHPRSTVGHQSIRRVPWGIEAALGGPCSRPLCATPAPAFVASIRRRAIVLLRDVESIEMPWDDHDLEVHGRQQDASIE